MGEKIRVNNEALIGQRFGRWTVLSLDRMGKHIYFNCRCDCGTEKSVNRESLLSGKSKSCGCLHQEIVKNNKGPVTHGRSRTKLYAVWKGMRQRCKAKSGKNFRNYTSKGIRVCPDWEDFNVFYQWAMTNGYQEGLDIDRIDGNGNYCPDNCRWVTRKANCDNRWCVFHYEYNGKKYNAQDLSLLLGFNSDYISYNLRQGKTIKEIRGGKIIWQKTA